MTVDYNASFGDYLRHFPAKHQNIQVISYIILRDSELNFSGTYILLSKIPVSHQEFHEYLPSNGVQEC